VTVNIKRKNDLSVVLVRLSMCFSHYFTVPISPYKVRQHSLCTVKGACLQLVQFVAKEHQNL